MKPVRLKIKPQSRDKPYYKKQYPLNKLKRAAMINETRQCDINGFWEPVIIHQYIKWHIL